MTSRNDGKTAKAATGFSTRTYLCLRWHPKIMDDFSPENIATLTSEELLEIPNFGMKSLAEVKSWLNRHGLTLAGYEPPPKPRCPCCGQVIPRKRA